MADLTAANMMARSEATFSPDMGIYEALTALLRRKLTGAPVVDAEGKLLGMLTERDCLKALVGWVMDGLPHGKVRDYMSAPAESINPTARVYDVVQIFLNKPYRKLPVVDQDGRVIGQVSRRDTLVALARLGSKPHQDSRPPDSFGVDSAMKRARDQK